MIPIITSHGPCSSMLFNNLFKLLITVKNYTHYSKYKKYRRILPRAHIASKSWFYAVMLNEGDIDGIGCGVEEGKFETTSHPLIEFRRTIIVYSRISVANKQRFQ